jgi:hypothetical protein
MEAQLPPPRLRFLGAMDQIILAQMEIAAQRLPLPFPLV